MTMRPSGLSKDRLPLPTGASPPISGRSSKPATNSAARTGEAARASSSRRDCRRRIVTATLLSARRAARQWQASSLALCAIEGRAAALHHPLHDIAGAAGAGPALAAIDRPGMLEIAELA